MDFWKFGPQSNYSQPCQNIWEDRERKNMMCWNNESSCWETALFSPVWNIINHSTFQEQSVYLLNYSGRGVTNWSKLVSRLGELKCSWLLGFWMMVAYDIYSIVFHLLKLKLKEIQSRCLLYNMMLCDAIAEWYILTETGFSPKKWYSKDVQITGKQSEEWGE